VKKKKNIFDEDFEFDDMIIKDNHNDKTEKTNFSGGSKSSIFSDDFDFDDLDVFGGNTSKKNKPINLLTEDIDFGETQPKKNLFL